MKLNTGTIDICLSHLLLLQKVEGFLQKMGEKGIVKSWKTRWFTLDQNILAYYKERSDPVPISFILLQTVCILCCRLYCLYEHLCTFHSFVGASCEVLTTIQHYSYPQLGSIIPLSIRVINPSLGQEGKELSTIITRSSWI